MNVIKLTYGNAESHKFSRVIPTDPPLQGKGGDVEGGRGRKEREGGKKKISLVRDHPTFKSWLRPWMHSLFLI